MRQNYLTNLLLLFCLSFFSVAYAQTENSQGFVIQGNVVNKEGAPLVDAFVYLDNSGRYVTTNKKGFYKIVVPKGTYKVSSSLLGYISIAKSISTENKVTRLNFEMETDANMQLDEVQLKGKSALKRVRETAYNVVALDTKGMANSTKDLSDALEQASGVKIRRTGGVGSNASISLNGFTGNHVKVFMNGIPMQGFGSAFQINNIPVNIAERIEVYKGVVPIELGADALGGAINIITKKGRNTYVDASYSYGSFNTHKSNVNLGLTSKSGLTFQLNAFQNSSDNDYKVKTQLLNLETNELSDKEYWFKRFHDNYHNETVIAKVGVVGKSWADRLLVGTTLGNEEADIQNAAIMKIVYGGKKRKAKTSMATLEYVKKNLFVKHLKLTVSGNYSKVHNQVIDTLARQYNWAGDYRTKNSKGEGIYTSSVFDNKSGVGMFNLRYSPSRKHHFALNNVLTTYSRQNTDDKANADNSSEIDFIKRSNIKNVLGGSYRFSPTKKWSTSFFGKWYKVSITGPVEVPISTNKSTYQERKNEYGVTGYGAATTYILTNEVQLKASFEKTYRLPSERELFGDEIIETGDASLKAENSRNINFNVTYSRNFNENNHFYVDAGFVYRDIQDYIRRVVDESKGGASYQNHGKVKNLGVDLEAYYSYKNTFSLGGNMTYQNIRNKEEFTTNGTKALNYDDRIPNVPYLFGSADASYNLFDVFGEENTMSFGYHLNYTHEFFKEWESYGSSKITIPGQLSHDFDITYSLKNGRYNIAFEVRDLTNEILYDNYSLQKPGRSFAIKLRYFFSKHN